MDLSQLQTFRIAACDLNGQMRGKRVPGAYGPKLDRGAVRMPFSALNVDLWGADIAGSPLLFDSGDADGVLRPTDRGAMPVPWIDGATALVPMEMFHDDGRPFAGDPRHALASVLDRYAARGWRVVAATELEFTLLDAGGEAPRPPVNPLTRRRLINEAVLSMAEMDAFDAYFTDLYRGCEAMGIPAQTAISESGVGQFEINLDHQDAMRCADDTWLFKGLVRGLARKHGFAATFMAKPYSQDAGNGMHVHFSVVDAEGRNVFNDGGPRGTDLLRQAVAGCLAAMPGSTLIFAPHGNSYERLVPEAHAPTGACWAYENRTAAIRVPGGAPAARRIEHRVAGGDINPYLMLASVLGAALIGIEDGLTPPDPITGNAYEIADLPQLHPDLAAAVEAFATDPMLARILPAALVSNMALTKRQEIARFAARDPDTHWLSYLEAV
ncbi:glutamate--putrescine ligase [Cribrihabitans marinus]|uniref:Glutamate--putrescine ligase n=1 Tax=Cribrihabitans marinus TaxID=1227549 RepID=A0A1H6TET5_9RHOB|nr:glutamine synthetase family protein [Cribrihabitans marinus]GGH22284.1 glutamine synthetase [Cribrihabitans marinus]SEI75597.1 glutamate--putrescine ligase [Cribrihabitans marinus]